MLLCKRCLRYVYKLIEGYCDTCNNLTKYHRPILKACDYCRERIYTGKYCDKHQNPRLKENNPDGGSVMIHD